jgi:hypothetical protein
MRRPILFVFAVVMTAALLAQSAAPVAHACFVTADPVVATDVIVAGRISGWDIVQTPWDDANRRSGLVAATVHMEVDETIKGPAVSSVNFVVGVGSSSNNEDGSVVQFGADPCSPFHREPTGTYAIVALSERDGFMFPWPANRSYLGSFQDEQEYGRRLSDLHSELRSDPPLLPIAAVGVALPVAYILGGALFFRGRRGAG